METMMPTAPPNKSPRTVAGGGPFHPSSWLEGLGIMAGSPPRHYDHRTPACNAPTSMATSPRRDNAAAAAIADDIRNDRELFFPDDDDEPSHATGPPDWRTGPISPTEANAPRTQPHAQESYQPVGRRSSATAPGGTGLRRLSSQQKMASLQREVDAALEYFGRETEDGLDDDGVDGDGYLTSRRRASFHKHCGNSMKGTMMAIDGSSDDGSDCVPGTAATSMATSVVTDCDNGEYNEFQSKLLSFSNHGAQQQQQQQQAAQTPGAAIGGGLSLKHKTKSILTLPLSLIPSQTAMNCAEEEDAEENEASKFENVISREIDRISVMSDDDGKVAPVDFGAHASLRNAMEPFLAVARIRREEARQQVFEILDKVNMPEEDPATGGRRGSTSSGMTSFHIGSTYGVPYPALRNESSFLYDVESFPLGEVLAETMGVSDLSRIHISHPLIKDKGRLMAPLKDRGRRRKFHQCFDSFITSQVIPLLHSQALSKGVFYTNRHQLARGTPQRIVYRYQAFPCINIVRPGECSTDPHCDMAQGHSIGNISYHVPLTPTFGTNAVYTESRPGREDFHPLSAKSPGLGFQFDGARCLHFNLKNETDVTRVSLNFRIAIVRAPDFGNVPHDPDDQLCCPELLRDRFSMENPGFYDEVVVNVGDVPRSFMPGPVATKRRGISVIG